MRLPTTILHALVLVAAMATIANAGGKTDQTKFDAALSKFAPTFNELFALDSPFKPRGLCVCANQTDQSKSGFLYKDNDKIFCAWPVFLMDGSFAKVAVPCSPFVVLSK